MNWLLGALAWLALLAGLAALGPRGREMALLGAWGLLTLPLLASLGRLLLA